MSPLARIFRALSDPTRLRIVNVLLEAEGCVCEIEPVLGLPQSLVSRHLAYLRYAGMVKAERDGMRVNYSLTLNGDLGQALEEFLRKTFLTEEQFQLDILKWRHRKDISSGTAKGGDAAGSVASEQSSARRI